MEKQNNPSKNSKSPPSSPPPPPPPPPSTQPPSDDNNTNTNPPIDLNLIFQNVNTTGGPPVIKTAQQVLEELSDNILVDLDAGAGVDAGIGGAGAGGASSVPLVGGGGSTVVVQQEGGSAGGSPAKGKKRKSSEVRDPPTGKPSCPVCFKEFNSWKGAFGHMRKHPERGYRGFHKPPSFTTPSSLNPAPAAASSSAAPAQGDGAKSGNAEGTVRGISFDLNEPIDAEGSSIAAAEEASVPAAAEEPKDTGIDLNVLPPADEEDDNNEGH